MESMNESLFARISLFGDGMTVEEAGRVAGMMRARAVDAGQILIQQGTPADSLFVVAAGELSVAVEGGDERVEVARLRAGQWAGELALLDPGPASATVTAETDGRVLELTHPELRELMRSEPSIAAHLLRALTKVMAGRVRRTSHGLIHHGRWDFEPAVEAAPKSEGWFSSLVKTMFHHDDTTQGS